MNVYSHCIRQYRNDILATVGLPALRGSARLSLLWWLLLAAGAGISALYFWQVQINKPSAGQGLIELSNVELEQSSGYLQLRAGARIRLPPTIQAGLDSGVPLTFVLNLSVRKQKRFWPDSRVFESARHYTLTYYELTRHYRVSELETDNSRNFRSLSAALAGLGQLGRMNFPVDEQQEKLLKRKSLVAIVDMRLSKSALPLPLQPIIRSSWTLQSEEYRWLLI